MPLTALKVLNVCPGRHADMQGLYLVVRNGGSRSWMLRVQHRGRRRDFGLGSASDVSLADARIAVADYRRMIRNGCAASAAALAERLVMFIRGLQAPAARTQRGFFNDRAIVKSGRRAAS